MYTRKYISSNIHGERDVAHTDGSGGSGDEIRPGGEIPAGDESDGRPQEVVRDYRVWRDINAAVTAGGDGGDCATDECIAITNQEHG